MLGLIRHSLNVLLLILVVLALVWSAAWKLAGAHMFSVQSGSMSPAIKKGDLVIDIRPRTVQPGEVITYRSQLHPGQEVTHRIIRTDMVKQTVTTKGDSLSTADPTVPASAITGKVFKVVPKAGYVYDWVHTPAGLISTVYLPLLFIVTAELWTLAGQFNYRRYSLLKTQ